jgi:hypothetical protein
MTQIVIKKRVSFEFLGDEYKDAYIVLKSIPTTEYKPMIARIEKQKSGLSKTDEVRSLVKERFISGEWPDESGKLEPLSVDDLDGLDGEALSEAFAIISGQTIPKSLRQSVNILNQVQDQE